MIEFNKYSSEEIKKHLPDLYMEKDFHGYATTISGWTHLYANQMTPRSPEKILSYFEKGHSVLIANETTNELLAHGAIKWISTKNPILEVGTIVVNPKYKSAGYGAEVTKATVELANKKYPEHLKFAFCNSASLGIFKKLGFVEAELKNLPTEVWDGCLTCQNKPKPETRKLCCDTIVVLPK
ncbi:MAG TPA: GNAT family N-acetyltransferase [Patescibacteria group bacterium]|nr:GNAT family N-acetyltransferase [Patescibacteria group bacterium]